MTKEQIEKIRMRVYIREVQLEGDREALHRDIRNLRGKLDAALSDVEKKRPNTQISANLGYAVADIVRRQAEVEAAEREIRTLRDIEAEGVDF